MKPDQFERRLQECWDARRDPAADAELGAWLLEHPEVLEEFARRRALIAALGTVSGTVAPEAAAPETAEPDTAIPGTGAPRWLRHRASAAVLVAALAAACALLWFRRPDAASGAGRVPAGRVLAATLESIRPTAACTVTWQEREVLFATPDGRLEIIQQRSERR